MYNENHPSPFRPYWRRTGLSSDEDPPSWIFFVVAKVSGQFRPVAVASSKSYDGESIKGYCMVAACRRLLTIFSSPANRHAIQAEVALASKYYAKCTPERHELPELPRLGRPHPAIVPQQRMWEFPFISTCLLQGIKWHTQIGWHHGELEYLGTIYQDTSLVWGMTVIDITNLDSIEYGIVAFKVARMIYIDSWMMDGSQTRFPRYGQFRVAEEERPRHALSAREYITKFEVEMLDEDANQKDLDFLDGIGVVSDPVMHNIWPPSNVVSQEPSATADPGHLDGSPLIIGMEESIWSLMVARRNSSGNNQIPSTNHNGHLSLEHLKDPLPELSTYINNTSIPPVASISIQLGQTLDDTAPLIQALSSFQDLQELVVVSQPHRTSDASSFSLYFQLLNLGPSSNLFRCKLTISGLFSAGLAKQPWLESNPAWHDGSLIRSAHFQRFPVQQIMFRIACNETELFTSAYLSDALLSPSRFVNGLLESLYALANYSEFTDWEADSHFLPFCSCSTSLELDVLSNSEITPLPAEASADSHLMERNLCRVHDLDLASWTILVTCGYSKELPRKFGPGIQNRCIRYAFVRPRNHLIAIDPTSSESFSVSDLEILGMKEFLSVTSSTDLESDNAAVDQRLQTIRKKLENGALLHEIPKGFEAIAPMTEAEVVVELPKFLDKAKATNEQIVKATRHKEVEG